MKLLPYYNGSTQDAFAAQPGGIANQLYDPPWNSTEMEALGVFMSMFFKINPSNGVPVYEQVARQVMFAVAAGTIQNGEMIPSVRELARELAINPNTVARAFRDLQDKEVVEPVRGTGLVVTRGAKGKCVALRTRMIRDRLRDVIDEARQSQLEDSELEKIIEMELQGSKKRKR